jgi:hypothetical protein
VLLHRRIDQRVVESAVGREGAVGDHQRDVPVADGEVQVVLGVVVHQVEARQAAPDRRPGEAVPVVVVPERRRALLHGIGVVPLPDDAPRGAVRVPGMRAGGAVRHRAVRSRSGGQDQVHRVAVALGRGVAAVQVHDGRLRQLVPVPDDGTAAAARHDRGAGESAAVGPCLGPESGQDLEVGDLLDDFVIIGGPGRAGGPKNRRHRKRHLELDGKWRLAR